MMANYEILPINRNNIQKSKRQQKMKLSQASSQTGSQKKQNQGQLKQLIESYYLQVGTDMLPILQLTFNHNCAQTQLPSNVQKLQNVQKANQVQLKQRKQFYGKMILFSTGIVLLSTMIGLFQHSLVLIFGLFWGVIFTKYDLKLNNQLTEMLIYWIILALITTLENILVLTLFFMPFYHSLKLFFIISLLYPQTNLKKIICTQYFIPRMVHLMQTLQQKK